MSDNDLTRYSGLVALVGRPNVGKSTLLNALIDEKLSIVTPKPQTTRHRIVGVMGNGNTQIGLIDAPGVHLGTKTALNRVMNENAATSVTGVDLAVLVVDRGRWTDDDAAALRNAKASGVPVGLVINKADLEQDKNRLLPAIEQQSQRDDFAFVVPVSAHRSDNLEALTSELNSRMPQSEFLFDDDALTDRPMRFLVAEIVREKLIIFLQQELPYQIAVEVEEFDSSDPTKTYIQALIWVARDNQKSIVIGRRGSMLEQVGRSARLALADWLETRVDLRLFVRVDPGWPDDEARSRTRA
ncbi:GTPase Era [Salinisphaera sp. USBA-960]|uniref:GTPase Era n=1 Tax=Salinisphaera orenii TaxID=856731 RepID=UPI000DBE0366|nr:GTPase Era [Salifodinibacter halophilus]NNC26080.1 GTPase Era [Salifodinibacter halophilus]